MTLRVPASICAVAAVAAAMFAPVDPKLPPPFHSPSVTNRPRVVERPQGAGLKVPSGFHVDVWAEGFSKPRLMLQGPGGEVLLSDSVPNGAVYVLLDKNKDMKPEDRRKIIEGLDRPYGMAFWPNFKGRDGCRT